MPRKSPAPKQTHQAPKPAAMKVIGTMTGEVGEKRFYMPGVTLSGPCPKCSADYERDFAHDYLSYPAAGKPFEFTCYCGECDHEWEVPVILSVSLALAVPS